MDKNVIMDLGFVESYISELPAEYEVKFHGAKNKEGKLEIKLSDTNQIALAYTIDKLLQVEQRTGMAMCKLFADMDRKGITYGFDTAKKAIIAQTEYSDTTVESMIRVGKCFFKAEGTPVIDGIEDFTWAAAQKLVTVKNNNDNNELMGIDNLQSYIYAGYITKDTPTRKIDEFKSSLVKGFIPKDWVDEGFGLYATVAGLSQLQQVSKDREELEKMIFNENEEIKKIYHWVQGLDHGNLVDQYSLECPYLVELPTEKKPQENKPKENKPQENKPQDNAPQDNAPQDNAPQETAQQETAPIAKTPLEFLDAFQNAVNENTVSLNEDELKKLKKAITDISKILKDKVFTI